MASGRGRSRVMVALLAICVATGLLCPCPDAAVPRAGHDCCDGYGMSAAASCCPAAAAVAAPAVDAAGVSAAPSPTLALETSTPFVHNALPRLAPRVFETLRILRI